MGIRASPVDEGSAVTTCGRVVVLDYGAGNVRSVVKALEHEGADVVFSSDPAVARQAGRLVLPGQGHFGQCIGSLEEGGLADAIREVVADERPFLGICVGMQLLYEGSEEAPGVPGLGLLPGLVRRIPTELHLPHVGWNGVAFSDQAVVDPLLAGFNASEPRYFYHVHSYAQLDVENCQVLGVCRYDVPFASVVGHGRVWGAQFHPEKSQEWGLKLLRNFARL
ncbi:MAG: imidazole glycerol phosphate synthase subunit HisH [Gemmatimonas sp.]|nr:imidazole glycerol phosphate synthase subunit HisH [Gemmatimonas sp.]